MNFGKMGEKRKEKESIKAEKRNRYSTEESELTERHQLGCCWWLVLELEFGL